MELNVGRDEGGDKLCISRSTSTTASNVVRDEVYLIFASSARAFRSSVVLQQTFSQFLSATIGPLVARVSAPRTMPSWKRQPTMVVPVLVALGTATPFASRNSLRMVFEKSNPAPRYTEDDDEAAIDKEVKFDCASHKQRDKHSKVASLAFRLIMSIHTLIGLHLFASHQIQTHTAQRSSSHSTQQQHTRSAPRSPWVSIPAPACVGLMVTRSSPSSPSVLPRCPKLGTLASHTVRPRTSAGG